MPRGLKNWKFRDVRVVLEKNNFRLHHVSGSHYHFIGTVKKKIKIVQVPYHAGTVFKPRTLKGMILQSGLSKENWGIS